MGIPQRQLHPQPWYKVVGDTLMRHISFLGPGLIAAVAYCDPGNWATDMEAGSRFGYKLLFIVLLSGLFAVLLQILCCRLGAVTGLDLSTQTRRWVLGLPIDQSEPYSVPLWKYRLRYWGLLIPLYIVNEVAIVATELAELIGTAISLNLLFPALPLWAGVMITTVDVFLVLCLYRPSSGVRLFEMIIGVLVLIVLVCFCVLLGRVRPNWGDVFHGYVPSSTIISSQGLYISISILGATIMPHSLILGSHFATIDRLDGESDLDSDSSSAQNEPTDEGERPTHDASTSRYRTFRMMRSVWRRLVASNIRVPEVLQTDKIPPLKAVSFQYLNITLQHSSWDIAICLVLFAITINSAILIVASAAFFYGHNERGEREVVGDLFQAFALLRDTTGKSTAILFAVALLAAGESSSVTVTLAGQIISEGFIRWRLTPFMRRLLTRAIAVIPAMIVAAVAGRDGLDSMLVASQVALSMALPFVSFPLLVITCSPKRMSRELAEDSSVPVRQAELSPSQGPLCLDTAGPSRSREPSSVSSKLFHIYNGIYEFVWPSRAYVDFDTGKFFYKFHNAPPIAILSWCVFLLICIADMYVLITSIQNPSNA